MPRDATATDDHHDHHVDIYAASIDIHEHLDHLVVYQLDHQYLHDPVHHFIIPRHVDIDHDVLVYDDEFNALIDRAADHYTTDEHTAGVGRGLPRTDL